MSLNQLQNRRWGWRIQRTQVALLAKMSRPWLMSFVLKFHAFAQRIMYIIIVVLGVSVYLSGGTHSVIQGQINNKTVHPGAQSSREIHPPEDLAGGPDDDKEFHYPIDQLIYDPLRFLLLLLLRVPIKWLWKGLPTESSWLILFSPVFSADRGQFLQKLFNWLMVDIRSPIPVGGIISDPN